MHQATTVAVVCDDSGRVIAHSVVPTEAAALLQFVRGMRGAVHVAFEEGTQAQWLYDLLVPPVAQVLVCDPWANAARGKGDWHDAEQLADQLQRGDLRAVYHGSPQRARSIWHPHRPHSTPASIPRRAAKAPACQRVDAVTSG